jgi:ABC-type branched-subunit amino acid transport system substrate-binding protein
MASETDFALVGRDTTAALLEWLIHTAHRPLPVVVAFGSGGAGKTKLSEHVEERWRNLAPVAYVNFDDAGSKTCRDVLTKAANDFHRYSNRQFGRLALPRFELAMRILAAQPPKEVREREKLALRVVAGKPRVVRESTATVAVGISWLLAIGPALLALLRWVRLAAVAAPPGLRWPRALVLPDIARALSWYERRAPRLDPQLPQGCPAAVVLARLWDSVWDAGERPDPRARLVADRLLVAAFLADIGDAYRHRRHYRKLNCVLLLDGADLLYPDEENRLTRSASRRAGGVTPTVLELLAEGKLRQPRVPLLVVATKQARPDLPDCLSDAEAAQPAGDDGAEGDPGERAGPVALAHELYHRWRVGVDRARPDPTAYLPVLLSSFTATHTRQFLVEWSRQQERTGRRETLAEELHAATRGHPLAVVLVSDALANRTRLDRATPVVRAMLAEPVDTVLGSPRTVEDLLVQRFLQRFPEDESDDRRYHRRVLARLAVPRRLGLEMLVELMPRLDSQLDARATWRRLGTYSFMSADGDGHLVMHPLLRDLLCVQLREGRAGAGPGYEETQRLFYEFHADRAHHSEAALHEVIYHALALGDVRPAAEAVVVWSRLGQPDWPLLLEALVEAPQPPPPLASARVEAAGPLDRGRREPLGFGRLTRALPGRRVIAGGDGPPSSPPQSSPQSSPPSSPPPADRLGAVTPADDGHRRAQELVRAVWALRSCTGTDRWTADRLDAVADAYLAVDAAAHPADETGAGGVSGDGARAADPAAEMRAAHSAAQMRAAHYRRLARADEVGASVDPPAPPPWVTTAARPEYPRIWLPRRAVAAVAALCVVATATGYAAQHLTYWQAHCARPGYATVDRLRLPALGRDQAVLLRMDDGQCIGVTDAAGPFIDGATTPDDTEVNVLTGLVAAENASAVRQARLRHVPYATVVVATMLSSVVEPNRRDLSAGVNELRGAYLAQRQWNHVDDRFLGKRVPVRLLFANLGGNSKYADRTAELIRERAAADPSIVGVTGMGQTRRETVRAAGTVGTPAGTWAGLPIVGSAPSGDDFTGKPNFFRTAPPNKRQAEVGVRFLSGRFPGRHVWLVSDSDDLYSSGLAGDYAYLLTGAPFPRVDSEPYRRDDSGAVDVFREIVRNVCAARDAPPLVVYTGRANEATTLLRDLQDPQQGCPGRAVVMGGDDLSQLETGGYRDLNPEHYSGDFLFFTTFGPTAEGWQAIRQSKHADTRLPGFFADYDRVRTEQSLHGAYQTQPNGHIMLAYDAVTVLLIAVEERRPAGGPARLPTRAQISDGLRSLRPHEGVAGVVNFGGADGTSGSTGRDPVDKLVVVQQVARADTGVVSRFVTADGAL